MLRIPRCLTVLLLSVLSMVPASAQDPGLSVQREGSHWVLRARLATGPSVIRETPDPILDVQARLVAGSIAPASTRR